MDSYINHLLEDMKAAASNVPPPIDYALLYPDHPAIEQGLGHIAAWELSPSKLMSDWFGISHEVFPPGDKLSEAQAAKLVEGMLDLWTVFNFHAEYPEGVSAVLLYKAMLNKWEHHPIQYITDGYIGVEFCQYDPDLCPWAESHCSCKDFARQLDEEQNLMDKEHTGETDDLY